MPLVKIKRFAQVTIPPEARKKFNLAEGDYLDVETVEEGILLKPVAVVEKHKAWQDLFAVIDKVKPRGPKSRKTPKQEEEEIASIIKEYRKEAAQKKKRNA